MTDRTSSTTPSTQPFAVNGRRYTPPPRAVVLVCIDGCADEYLDAALLRGRMPNVAAMLADGYRGLVRGALPSFTNVNNAAIVSGAPPAVTGISGNFFLDPRSGEAVMMNAPEYFRCDTILAAAAGAGRRVAMITAKDKLRRLLSRGFDGIAFSAETATQARPETHGIDAVEALVGRPAPPIYSGDASLFVLEAGAALLEADRADFLYLTLSDYVQHKHGPDEPAALDFYAGIDAQVGRYRAAGVVIGITADHGMNGKIGVDGRPNVLYVESLLRQEFDGELQVICPITDPYVLHHGALGGCVFVHVADPSRTADIAAFLLAQHGITEVYDRATAATKLELPADRIGDLVVLGARDHVLGKTPADHDLTLLGGVLRSHGGRYEEMVPLLLSEPLSERHAVQAAGDPRSFDAYTFLLDGVPA